MLAQIGGQSLESSSATITESGAPAAKPIFTTEAEQKVAKVAYEVINRYEQLPSSNQLLNKGIQEEITARVKEEIAPLQGELAGVMEQINVAAVVAKTTELVVQQTIDIPRILVVPKGEVTSGFNPFTLDASSIHYQPVERDILIQHLRTHQQETLTSLGSAQTELRIEDYLVRALIDFDDISYDHHADLLYELAGQMVKHLRGYLNDKGDVQNVLQYYQRQLGDFIHSQMQAHHWEKASGYDVVVSKGFTALRSLAFTAPADEAIHNFRHPPADKTKIAQLVFWGFSRCLYPVQKFQSDTERVLSIILDRDATKWFKPGRGQFQIFYKWGADQREYQPDFVAETTAAIYMLEPKMRKEMEDGEVIAKKDAAVRWCETCHRPCRNEPRQTLEVSAHPPRCDCGEYEHQGLGGAVQCEVKQLGNAVEESTIANLLTLGSLGEAEAKRRAPLVLEDLHWIDFDTLSFSAQPYPYRNPETEQIVAIPIPEYHFGDTGFSINNAENAEDNVAEWFGGTGFDRGNLQFLSQVSLIGRQLIPNYWHRSASLRHALRNPPQHLNTVEEVWWLNRWLGPESIEMSHQLLDSSGTDVDWTFVLGDNIRVNLEIKRIPSDCIRHARGRSFSAGWFDRFCKTKVLPKFRPSEDHEINVLAISLFGELDREVQIVLSDWLVQKQSLVDAILVASRESRRRSSFDSQFLNEKARLLRHWLRQPDEEDGTLAFALEIPTTVPGFPSVSRRTSGFT